MSVEQQFGRSVRDARARLGWSQTELAKQLQAAGVANFHQTTVARLEKGERPTRLDEAAGIAVVLGISIMPDTYCPRCARMAHAARDAALVAWEVAFGSEGEA